MKVALGPVRSWGAKSSEGRFRTLKSECFESGGFVVPQSLEGALESGGRVEPEDGIDTD